MSSLVIVRIVVVVVVNRDGIVDDVDDVGVTPVRWLWLDSAANAMVIVHHWKVINMFGRVIFGSLWADEEVGSAMGK